MESVEYVTIISTAPKQLVRAYKNSAAYHSTPPVYEIDTGDEDNQEKQPDLNSLEER